MIGAIIALATSVCNLIATHEAMKYIDELKDAEMELIAENMKGDDADDGKIESLHKQIGVVLQSVNQQYAIYKNTPANSAPSV